jgi:6-phosphogluconolactonase
MPGELEPAEGARHYHDEIAEIVAAGPHVAFMGMGADCHVGGLFPGTDALDDPNYCAAVRRPDGLSGLTLTPSAMLACRSINLIVAGASKAEAVARAVDGSEPPESCPVRLLTAHDDITMWLDEPAASRLG